MSRTKLSININKVALIRNSRGENNPDLLNVAKDLLEWGADGITVHPRPDERHIRYDDLKPLSDLVATYPGREFNIEGYPTDSLIQAVRQARPDQVTLVPDPPDALTSSFGWDISAHQELLTETVTTLKSHDIRVSLFIDPDFSQDKALSDLNPDRVELYTYDYARQFTNNPANAIAPYKAVATRVHQLGIALNAGHDLNQENLAFFLTEIPEIQEVSIGHAFVCDSLYDGLHETLKRYQNAISASISGKSA